MVGHLRMLDFSLENKLEELVSLKSVLGFFLESHLLYDVLEFFLESFPRKTVLEFSLEIVLRYSHCIWLTLDCMLVDHMLL